MLSEPRCFSSSAMSSGDRVKPVEDTEAHVATLATSWEGHYRTNTGLYPVKNYIAQAFPSVFLAWEKNDSALPEAERDAKYLEALDKGLEEAVLAGREVRTLLFQPRVQLLQRVPVARQRPTWACHLPSPPSGRLGPGSQDSSRRCSAGG